VEKLREHITLSELQQRIRSAVEQSLPLPVWIVAEISELKVNSSGHCYIELIEKGEQQRATAVASARAVVWRQDYQVLSTIFFRQTGQRLQAGLKILCRVMVTYHPLYGLSLRITDIDSAYTVGETERARQETIAQLKADGVWDMNHELTLQPPLQRIAVVASGESAGYRDFINELRSSGYAFRVELFESVVQGAEAETAIINALMRVAEREAEFDVVVIIRGGGSVSDLRCFDNYMLASVVAQFPLPILTGIGHDKDTSVVDMVAHTPLKTPTAVATFLAQQMAQLEASLEDYAARLADSATIALNRANLHLVELSNELRQGASALLASHLTHLSLRREQLRSLTTLTLERERLRLLSAEEAITLHNPAQILSKGFALVHQNRRLIRSTEELTHSEPIQIQLHDGIVEAVIKSIEKIKK
jgi:exodeoxyribonuclease VII large subunit